MSSKWENFILHELTDEEIENRTDEEVFEFGLYLDTHPLPEEATVKGLLKKFGFKYDDLSEFAQNYYVGSCNTANRTENQIYINRPNSKWKHNIVINLNPNREGPYLTVQIDIDGDFIHEEAYTENGFLLYET